MRTSTRRGWFKQVAGAAVAVAAAPALPVAPVVVPTPDPMYHLINDVTKRVFLPGVQENYFVGSPLLKYFKDR